MEINKPAGEKSDIMTSAKIIKTEMIVLKSLPYSESSLIVRFLSKDIGKHSFIAKGIKKSKKQTSSFCEPFSHITANLYFKENSDLATLKEANLIDSFYYLRQSIETIALPSFVLEIIDKSSFPAQENPILFDSLLIYLKNMEGTPNPIAWTVFYLLKLSDMLGFKPHLDSCVSCSKLRRGGKFNFNFHEGGIICVECLGKHQARLASKHVETENALIDKKILESMLFCLESGYREGVCFNPGNEISKKLFEILFTLFSSNLETGFQTKSFIDQIMR